MIPHSSSLAWKIPWTEEPGRLHGIAKSQTRLSYFTLTFHFHALEKEMATHSSVLAWRIPGTGEPGGLLSMVSHRVGRDWSDLAAAAAAVCWGWLLLLSELSLLSQTCRHHPEEINSMACAQSSYPCPVILCTYCSLNCPCPYFRASDRTLLIRSRQCLLNWLFYPLVIEARSKAVKSNIA